MGSGQQQEWSEVEFLSLVFYLRYREWFRTTEATLDAARVWAVMDHGYVVVTDDGARWSQWDYEPADNGAARLVIPVDHTRTAVAV